MVWNNDKHTIWNTTVEEMVKDRMFYEFRENKFNFVNPIFSDIETPIICWALRYGATLKLEDLYTQFSKAVEMIVQTIK